MVIKVEIEKSQNSSNFDAAASFFRNELDQTKKMISRIIKNKEQAKEDESDDENHFYRRNNIAILGPRGVGKTSFLLSLKNFLEMDNDFKKVIWLPSIDPTRVEKNETFLVIVVANILKKIQQHNKDISQEIRDKLDILSRDFVVLAPQQVHHDQWKDLLGDPTSFAYELLSHAHSGLTLAKSFNDFLRVCLEKMKAHIFVQPIDDVDSGIEQGWPILETLRRYMASPHLITILSGDIRLYQSLVRKQHVDQFKVLMDVRHDVTQQEPKILLQTIELVYQIFQITNQYLAKLIPSHLRINLVPLPKQILEAAERGEEFISIEYDISKNPEETGKLSREFSEIYANFSHDFFNIPKPPKGCLELLKRTNWLPLPLLPLSTRNMLRFLKVIQPWALDNQTDKNKKEKENAIESLTHVFANSLYNGGIQTKDLLSIKRENNIEWFAEYCLDIERKFPGFWTLESHYEDEAMNIRALLLQGFLLQAWKDRGEGLLHSDGPFSYVIKVCFPCWIVNYFELESSEFQRLKEWLTVGYTKRYTYLVREELSYLLSLARKKLKEKQKERGNEKSADRKFYLGVIIAYLTERNSYCYAEEANFISRWFTFRTGSSNGSALISVLIGLARLADVLRDDPKNIQELKAFLYFLIAYSMQEPYLETKSNYNRSKTTDSKTGWELKEESNLLKYLFAWINCIKKSQIFSNSLVSPLVISRTFVRFIGNLESIYNTGIRDHPTEFRKIFEIWIGALLNSLLIEETIFKKGISEEKLRLDHLTDINFFIDNLRNSMNDCNGVYINYTLAMLCCPFFMVFLRNTFEDYDRNSEDKILEKISKQYIYEEMEKEIDEATSYDDFLKNLSRSIDDITIEETQLE